MTGSALSERRAAIAITTAAATRPPSCCGPKDGLASGVTGWLVVSALIWFARWPSERRHRRLGPSHADRLSLHEPERVPHFEVHRAGLAGREVKLHDGVLPEVGLIGVAVVVGVPSVAVAHAGSGRDDEVVVAGG